MIRKRHAAFAPLLRSPAKFYASWSAMRPGGNFWLFFVAAIFFNFGFAVFFFLFNLYLLDFGYTERSLGIIGSLMAVGSIAGTLPAGMLAGRFGLSRTLSCSVLLVAVLSALRVCTPWLPAQMGLAILTGMVLCTWAVCLSPAVASLTTDENRPLAFGLMFASGIGVAGLGAFVAGRLPDWLRELSINTPLSPNAASRVTLLLSCVIATAAIWPICRLHLRSAAARARLPRLSHPFLIRFLPAMAVWSIVTGSFAPFANVYFVHHLGLSLRSLGFVFSVSQAVQFAAVLSAPLLFRWTGVTSGIVSTQLATAAALGCLASIHTGAHAVWGYWAYVAVQYMSEPGIYNLLMDRVASGERNGASSLTFFVSAAAQAVASAGAGAAIVRFGYSFVLVLVAGLAVISAILFQRLSSCASQLHLPDQMAESTQV